MRVRINMKEHAFPLALPPEGLSRFQLSALSASTMLWVGIALPFFSIWLAARGLEPLSISWVLACQQVARPFGNPAITWVADRTRNIALTLLVISAGVVVLYILMAVAQSFWLLLSMAALAAFIQAPVGALVDALTLSEIRRRRLAGEALIDYGFVRSWGSFVVLVGMICGGLIVWLVNDRDIIWLIIACLLAPLVVVVPILRRQHSFALRHASSDIIEPLQRPYMVFGVICSAALIQSSHAVLYGFATLQWRAMDFSADVIGAFWAMGVACEIIFFMVVSRKLSGERRALMLLILGGSGAVVRWLLCASITHLMGIMALMSLHALSFAATHLGAVTLMSELVGPARRAQAQGWLQGAIALTTACATLGAGAFYSSGAYIYWGMAALAAAGTLGGGFMLFIAPRR
jgi:MFS transporter, PPP family, 3-phenylpropionic acid transporter